MLKVELLKVFSIAHNLNIMYRSHIGVCEDFVIFFAFSVVTLLEQTRKKHVVINRVTAVHG